MKKDNEKQDPGDESSDDDNGDSFSDIDQENIVQFWFPSLIIEETKRFSLYCQL